MHSIIPGMVLPAHMLNRIESASPSSNFTELVSANIYLPNELIDLSLFCSKLMASSNLVHGQKGIQFGAKMCNSLVSLCRELLETNEALANITNFDLIIEIRHSGEMMTHRIPFSIDQNPVVSISCSSDDLAFPYDTVDINSTIPIAEYQQILRRTPFFDHLLAFAQPDSLFFLNKKATLNIAFSADAVLQVEMEFKFKTEWMNPVSIALWKSSDSSSLLNFRLDKRLIKFEISWTTFFYNLSDQLEAVYGKLVQVMSEREVKILISRNRNNVEFLTNGKKILDKELSLYKLYEISQKLEPIQVNF